MSDGATQGERMREEGENLKGIVQGERLEQALCLVEGEGLDLAWFSCEIRRLLKEGPGPDDEHTPPDILAQYMTPLALDLGDNMARLRQLVAHPPKDAAANVPVPPARAWTTEDISRMLVLAHAIIDIGKTASQDQWERVTKLATSIVVAMEGGNAALRR